MAHLRHFLNGMILFSSISPDYEKNLQDELYGCFKYIGVPYDTLYKMPIRNRKYLIAKHNKQMEDEKRAMSGNKEVSGDMINAYTDVAQQRELNSNKR